MLGKKTKIFICITKSNWGGAQKYVYDVATNLPKDKFDISVLLGGLPGQGNSELKNQLDSAGIKTVVLKNSQRDIDAGKEFSLLFELIKIFRRERPDVVHLNSSKMGLVGAFAGRIAGVKKIVFTGHGWAFNEDRNLLSKIFFRIFHILTILLSHKTIAVSEITKKQISWPFNRKIIVIRNGLREINFKDKKTAQESLAVKTSGNPVWIGTISELHKNKGLKYAIEAVSKMKNVIFVIIGEGEEREKLEKLISKLGAKNKVFLAGRVESASTYLKAFDIFTLTSITEALPYVLLEAGFASLSVIASNVGGIPEIIKNNETGILVRPKDSEEIKNHIEYLIKNPEKARILGQSLKEKIGREFKLKDMIEKTVDTIKV